MLYKVYPNSNHCLFSELPSASTWVGLLHSLATAAAHHLEFVVLRCRTSQSARCFLHAKVRMWNDLPYTVFTPERWMGLSVKSTVGWFPELCFFMVLSGSGACGVAKAIYKQLFAALACDYYYYNNNNITSDKIIKLHLPTKCSCNFTYRRSAAATSLTDAV